MASLKDKGKKTQAREALKKLHYCHENIFPFEKYITAIKIKFQVLEIFDVPI